MLADQHTEISAGRALVRDAADAYVSGADTRISPSVAKLFCTEMAGRVADLAVQIHGGTGYMRGVPVERIYREVRLLRLYEGTSEIQRLIIGGALIREAQERSLRSDQTPAGELVIDGTLPLDGYVVATLEQAVAAPMATRHLADLGARVIKLERPGEGDFARNYDSAVHGLASHFVWLNRGKESVCVDLKSERGREIALGVIANADVFVQNCAPGVAERLGLDAATLRARHPNLIVANISGYGTAGPKRDHKAYDMLVQAESGMVAVTGTAEHPAKTGVPNADIAAGLYTAMSVISALLRRERTGAGATIDVAMFDAAVEWMGHAMYMQMYADKQVPRMGLSHASIAPYDGYPTADGHILIGVQNDRGGPR